MDNHIPNHETYISYLKNDDSQNKTFGTRKYFDMKFEGLLHIYPPESRKPILLIGSGLSITSGIKNWKDSLKYIVEKYDQFLKKQADKVLIGKEIPERAFELLKFKDDTEHLIDLAEFLKREFFEFGIEGKTEWCQILKDLYEINPETNKYYVPNENHRTIAKMFENIAGIITTNYDTLIEDALEMKYGKDIKAMVFKYNDDDSFAYKFEKDKDFKFILKLHGCIKDPDVSNNLIIGRQDYAKLSIENAATFKTIERIYNFDTKRLISIGYSMNDRDVLNLLSYMKEKFKIPYKEHGVRNVVVYPLKYSKLVKKSSKKINDWYKWMNTINYSIFNLPYPIDENFSDKYINFKEVLLSLQNVLENKIS